jgi:hypothetical protein
MKLKFNKNSMQDTATVGVGTIAGTYGSRALMAIAPSEFNEPLIRGVLGIGGFAVSGALQGKGIGVNLLKGLLMGVGLDNTVGAVNELVAPSLPADSSTQSQKIMKAMFGMNSPEEIKYTPTLMIPDASSWGNEFVEPEQEYKFKIA